VEEYSNVTKKHHGTKSKHDILHQVKCHLAESLVTLISDPVVNSAGVKYLRPSHNCDWICEKVTLPHI